MKWVWSEITIWLDSLSQDAFKDYQILNSSFMFWVFFLALIQAILKNKQTKNIHLPQPQSGEG